MSSASYINFMLDVTTHIQPNINQMSPDVGQIVLKLDFPVSRQHRQNRPTHPPLEHRLSLSASFLRDDSHSSSQTSFPAHNMKTGDVSRVQTND